MCWTTILYGLSGYHIHPCILLHCFSFSKNVWGTMEKEQQMAAQCWCDFRVQWISSDLFQIKTPAVFHSLGLRSWTQLCSGLRWAAVTELMGTLPREPRRGWPWSCAPGHRAGRCCPGYWAAHHRKWRRTWGRRSSWNLSNRSGSSGTSPGPHWCSAGHWGGWGPHSIFWSQGLSKSRPWSG